jgi:hypothetical protein
LEQLREKINNKDYLYEAIECLAMILSNEILNIPQGGAYSEWEGGKQPPGIPPKRQRAYLAGNAPAQQKE